MAKCRGSSLFNKIKNFFIGKKRNTFNEEKVRQKDPYPDPYPSSDEEVQKAIEFLKERRLKREADGTADKSFDKEKTLQDIALGDIYYDAIGAPSFIITEDVLLVMLEKSEELRGDVIALQNEKRRMKELAEKEEDIAKKWIYLRNVMTLEARINSKVKQIELYKRGRLAPGPEFEMGNAYRYPEDYTEQELQNIRESLRVFTK